MVKRIQKMENTFSLCLRGENSMVNLWEFANNLPFVQIRKMDGTVVTGKTIGVFDAEELGDEDNEDMIALDLDGNGVESVYQSEIESIERI